MSPACRIGYRRQQRRRMLVTTVAATVFLLLLWIFLSFAIASSHGKCQAIAWKSGDRVLVDLDLHGCRSGSSPLIIWPEATKLLNSIPSLADVWLPALLSFSAAIGIGVGIYWIRRWIRRSKFLGRDDAKRHSQIREWQRRVDRIIQPNELIGNQNKTTPPSFDAPLLNSSAQIANAEALLKIDMINDEAFRAHYIRVIEALNRVRTILGDSWWQRMRFKLSWTSLVSPLPSIEMTGQDDSRSRDVLLLLQALEELLVEYSNAGQVPLTVIIDEADKPESDDRLLVFNELKDLFNLNHVRWLVTVRPQDRAQFMSRRFLESQIYFDSIFHEVELLEPLTFADLQNLANHRCQDWPVSPILVAFCAAWSGGVPRDFIRLLSRSQLELEDDLLSLSDPEEQGKKFIDWATDVMDTELLNLHHISPCKSAKLTLQRNELLCLFKNHLAENHSLGGEFSSSDTVEKLREDISNLCLPQPSPMNENPAVDAEAPDIITIAVWRHSQPSRPPASGLATGAGPASDGPAGLAAEIS
jgi:hypothetical protein